MTMASAHGVVAVDVKYHEKLRLEQPKPENLWLTGRVHARSGAFHPRAFDLVKGRTDLWEPWLEHLLMFPMLQQPSAEWTWGRYIVFYPSDNADMAIRSFVTGNCSPIRRPSPR